MLIGVVALMGLWQSAAVAVDGWTSDDGVACKIARHYRSDTADFELRLWRATTRDPAGFLEYRPTIRPAAVPGSPPITGSLTLAPTGYRLPLKFNAAGSSAATVLTAAQYALVFAAQSVVFDDGVDKKIAALGLTREDMRTLDDCRSETLKKWGVDDGQLDTMPGDAVARWFTDDTYPAAAKRAGAQGATTAVLAANEGGTFVSCLIVGSSGNADLDAATCRVASTRGSLDPAPGRTRRYRLLTVRWTLSES